MKILKNDKIWKSIKGQNSKSYGPLATILPLHFLTSETKWVISFIEVGLQT